MAIMWGDGYVNLIVITISQQKCASNHHIAHLKVQFSSVQSLSRVRLIATPWITACQASLSITNSRSLLKLMSIESVMPSNHLILCVPFSACPQSFPASGSFQMSQLFVSGGQSIGVSAPTSILPMNTQDWSPLGWTDWISLQPKGLSRVFSNTTTHPQNIFFFLLSQIKVFNPDNFYTIHFFFHIHCYHTVLLLFLPKLHFHIYT